MTLSIYDIQVHQLNGNATSLVTYRGQVLLIVNVASKCGLTPQYTALEHLHKCYANQGLVVLGFPCNDFGAQEPGTEAEIQDFCQTNYGVNFPMFTKVNINSNPRHALYAYLIDAQPKASSSGNDRLQKTLAQHGLLPKQQSDVMWNFEKFLVGRNGEVLARYAPDVAPDSDELHEAIEAALG